VVHVYLDTGITDWAKVSSRQTTNRYAPSLLVFGTGELGWSGPSLVFTPLIQWITRVISHIDKMNKHNR
jgi:hypothetical protein